MTDAWIKVLDASSSRADVEQAIRHHVAQCVTDFSAGLEADHPDLSERDRFALIARALPIIQAKTRECFEKAWDALRADADATSSTVVH